jgi:hypothetical protein
MRRHINHRDRTSGILAYGLSLALLGTGLPSLAAEKPVELIQAKGEIPEDRLLDVGIEVFEPGFSGLDQATLNDKGIFPDIRRSEARYIPFQLKDALQRTGHWGAVRLVPLAPDGMDIVVSGKILVSNGRRLAVRIAARDATGREWLDRDYAALADVNAYRDKPLVPDPYQSLYYRVANDLLAARKRLDDRELVEVRQVARLRFAGALAPDAFAKYLKTSGKERVKAQRLPAADDPMLRRIDAIRERDAMFVDTLNEYYGGFHEKMEAPYGQWRKYSYDEQVSLDKIKKSARLKTILGAFAVLSGMFLIDGGSPGAGAAQTVAILGGSAAIQAGLKEAGEAKIHVASLKELGMSFETDVAPLLVEVEGQTLRLSGSAERQFATWRLLLHDIFATENGIPSTRMAWWRHRPATTDLASLARVSQENDSGDGSPRSKWLLPRPGPREASLRRRHPWPAPGGRPLGGRRLSALTLAAGAVLVGGRGCDRPRPLGPEPGRGDLEPRGAGAEEGGSPRCAIRQPRPPGREPAAPVAAAASPSPTRSSRPCRKVIEPSTWATGCREAAFSGPTPCRERARIARAEEGERLSSVEALRLRGAELEAAEDWRAAAAEYEAALKLDAALAFALDGYARAADRARLQERLDRHLAAPRRLSADAVGVEAERLLQRVRELQPLPPGLERRAALLERRLAEARTGVRVELRSDGLTDVTVLRVGVLGGFAQRVLELRPGPYTIVGTRKGYRDVRRQVVIEAGRDPGDRRSVSGDALSLGSRAVELFAEGRRRLVEPAEFPLAVGGPTAAVPVPGTSEPLAFLGLERGEVFVQPAGGSPSVELTCNGVPLRASRWLRDGDEIVSGSSRLRLETGPDGPRLLLERRAESIRPALRLAEPPTDRSWPGAIPSFSPAPPLLVRPVEFRPRADLSPRPRVVLPRATLAIAAAVSAAVPAAFSSRPAIEVTVAPARMARGPRRARGPAGRPPPHAPRTLRRSCRKGGLPSPRGPDRGGSRPRDVLRVSTRDAPGPGHDRDGRGRRSGDRWAPRGHDTLASARGRGRCPGHPGQGRGIPAGHDQVEIEGMGAANGERTSLRTGR